MQKGIDSRTSRKEEASDANKINLRNEIQETYRQRPQAWFDWVFEHIDLPPTCRLLELGSGPGAFWQKNQARIPTGWEVLVSDSDHSMAREARRNQPERENGFRYFTVDGQALPYPDDTFDAILALGVLDLVPDLNQACGEAWRVLRPSGVFITSAGGGQHLKELTDRLKPFMPTQTANSLGGDETRFGLENGAQLLSPYFEEIVRHTYRDRLFFHDLQPILDYVLSEQDITWSISLDQLGSFVRQLKEDLREQGEIFISVEKGLFIARKKVMR